MNSIKYFLISVAIISCNTTHDSIFILPESYIGKIIVIYGQKNGQDELYRDNKRIYDIPSSGILKVKFSAEYGLSNFPEFYSGKTFNNKLPYITKYEDLPIDKIVVFGGSVGKANRDLKGTSTIEFVVYYVGTKAQIDKAIQETDTINYEKLLNLN